MKRAGLGLFYRYKFKISILSICLMTLIIGIRFVTLGSNNNSLSLIEHVHQSKQIDERVGKVIIEPSDKLTNEEINNINSELVKNINSPKNQNLVLNNKIEQNNLKNKLVNNLNTFKSIKNINQNNINFNNNNNFNRGANFKEGNYIHINNQYQNNMNQIQDSDKPPFYYESTLKNLERIVHIDLKGAPPKPDYLVKFIPLLKEYGATGILLEYEDTFPYEGILAEAKYGHAYSVDDIKLIKNLAKQNGLKIIPLVQTYGHLEWLLKLKKFAHLREVYDYPQVITPCLEESYAVLYEMIDQVIKLHDDVEHFHVGCDEVYYKLMHEKCFNHPNRNDFAQAFMSHLIKIAKYVRTKLPKAKVIFWDDMMHGMEESTLEIFKKDIEELELQPMMWGYMEDVQTYFQPYLYEKYGRIFGKIWIATAYKGASGELATLTSIEHHYLNHLSWIDVMYEKSTNGILKFIGVALTGWSRYDHFLALCDILPQSIPSLVFNLQVMQFGKLNDLKKREITNKLGCDGPIPWNGVVRFPINCKFPGHEVYEVIMSLDPILISFKNDMEYAKKYVSPINLEYNYLHKKRTAEVMEKLNYNYMAMTTFKNRFISACNLMYWEDTAIEWLSVYFIPQLDELYNIMLKIKNLSSQTDWKPRPLPIKLKQYPNNF